VLHIVIFLFSRWLTPCDCKSEKGKRKLPGEKLPALTPVPGSAEFEKNATARQTNSAQVRIANSSSTKAVNIAVNGSLGLKLDQFVHRLIDLDLAETMT
jgi:hypothetical protein